MSSILDEDWKLMRGIEVQSVGIASISDDEESQKLIQMRNQGAMLKRRVDLRRICAGGNGPRNRGGGLQCERFRRRVHGDWNGNAVRCRDGGGLFSKQPAANKAGTSRIRRLEMRLRRAKRGRGSVLFPMRQKTINAGHWECPKCHGNAKGISAPDAENRGLRRKRNAPNAAARLCLDMGSYPDFALMRRSHNKMKRKAGNRQWRF